MAVQRARRREQAQEGRAQVRAAILHTARQLVEARMFGRVGINELMDGTGMGRTAFYRYFADQESVLLALFDEAVEDLRSASQAWMDDRTSDIDQVLLTGVAVYAQHAPLLRSVAELALTDERLRTAYTAAIDEFTEAVERRIKLEQERGHARGLDPRATARALVWMNERFESMSLQSGDDLDQVAHTLSAIWQRVLYGVVDDTPPKGRPTSR
jgi:AcrR family transcriptional regulator